MWLIFSMLNSNYKIFFFFLQLQTETMPLITITGYPTSGKSTRANEIKEYLSKRLEKENKSYRIHVLNDESLHIPKEAYKGN